MIPNTMRYAHSRRMKDKVTAIRGEIGNEMIAIAIGYVRNAARIQSRGPTRSTTNPKIKFPKVCPKIIDRNPMRMAS